jgi:hypothetical protein
MDELRRDVNEAFEKGQSELGDLRGPRERVLRSALAAGGTRSDSRMPLAAGLGAVLIAAVVIATFAYVRAGSQTSHEGPPRPGPSPTPLGRPLNVPDTTPVILYGDPVKPDQVDGMTWDGKLSGVVGGPVGTDSGNPAATLFATSTEITDRSGRLIAAGNFGAKYFGGMWSDDEQQFCEMVPFDYLGANGVPATLEIVTPGQAARKVVQVGSVYEQASLSVIACSVQADRAVVVQGSGDGGPSQYWVVQLTTGKILRTRKFDPSHAPASVVASRDGMYVAENATTGSLPITAEGSTIFGPDGKPLVHLADWVEAFSWDGSLAVTDAGWLPGRVRVVNWRDGTIVWAAPDGYALQRVQAQPDGPSLAVWITTVAQLSSAGPVQADLYVIAAGGKVVALVRNTP